MNPNLANQIQTRTCPTLSAWHELAAECGASDRFFRGNDPRPQPDQSVRVSALWLSGDCAVLAPMFEASREIGLWVAPPWRRHGIGVPVLQHLLGQDDTQLVWATISHDNSDGPWMARILLRCGFAEYVRSAKVALWRRDIQLLRATQ